MNVAILILVSITAVCNTALLVRELQAWRRWRDRRLPEALRRV